MKILLDAMGGGWKDMTPADSILMCVLIIVFVLIIVACIFTIVVILDKERAKASQVAKEQPDATYGDNA